MKSDLKVLFYFKKNQRKKDGLCLVMGRIRVGNTIAQFSLKVDADAGLWDTKAGRMTGKSRPALKINDEINRINLVIHTLYKELRESQNEITAHGLKNASQGIASTQETVLDSFTNRRTNTANLCKETINRKPENSKGSTAGSLAYIRTKSTRRRTGSN